MTTENQIEKSLIAKLEDLKYTHRPDIRDKAALEQNFRQKFQSLNRVSLTDAEFARLRDKRVVFIFDECHRSQFGDNHKAIKEFFPKAQLFGFTGTPIFDENATYQQIDGNVGSYKATKDIFEKELHAYTITHAIDDKNVLSFHIDYFGKEGDKKPKKRQTPPPDAVINAILQKHDSATDHRRFNAILATASINNAIEYFELFKTMQAKKQAEDETFEPLQIACVFSPPAEGNKDVQQLQEDLETEKEDNKQEPEKKKAALKTIIDDYNRQYGANHTINEFDLYYQDVQQRIKDQKYSNADYPRKNKIDITIVVDMLLTGFDSKYLNTLYVDKNLKHHGLIQALSRTNRVLNDSKPWGNILDFRYQEEEVDDAIKLFSGAAIDRAREIWLVDPAPKVVEQYTAAVGKLETFMAAKGLPCEPSQVVNLKGDTAKAEFINHFKEVQKFKTQLEQYTDLDDQSKQTIEQKLPTDTLRSFKAAYLDTALELKRKQGKGDEAGPDVQQLEFDLVLFASSLIDLLAPLGLGWKVRREAELDLMADLVPYLQKLTGGREISGLNAYE
jgi:type I restriction enzyme R subunit